MVKKTNSAVTVNGSENSIRIIVQDCKERKKFDCLRNILLYTNSTAIDIDPEALERI